MRAPYALKQNRYSAPSDVMFYINDDRSRGLITFRVYMTCCFVYSFFAKRGLLNLLLLQNCLFLPLYLSISGLWMLRVCYLAHIYNLHNFLMDSFLHYYKMPFFLSCICLEIYLFCLCCHSSLILRDSMVPFSIYLL